ncbi:hypothetical protein R1sor_005824 [Riccia sorocarpa]|uniref:YDG domain-containing protein n=1 Tax=Riccia sorocarpa TaxID=122646 RepID=A0ABD3HLA9_9MARC
MMRLDGYGGRNPLLPPFSGIPGGENHLRVDMNSETTAERNICSPLYSDFVLPDSHRLPGEFTVDRLPGRYGGATGLDWSRGDAGHLRNVQVKIEKVEHVETHAVGLPFRTMLLPTDLTHAESEDVDMFPVSLPTDLRSSEDTSNTLRSEAGAKPSTINQSREYKAKKLTPKPVCEPVTILLSDSDSDSETTREKKCRRVLSSGQKRDSEKKKGVKESSVAGPTRSSLLTAKQQASSKSRLGPDDVRGWTPFKSLKRKFSFIDLDAVIDLDDDEPESKHKASSVRAGETSVVRGFPAADVKQVAAEVQTGASEAVPCTSLEAVALGAIGEMELAAVMEPASPQLQEVSLQAVEGVLETIEQKVSIQKEENLLMKEENPLMTEHVVSFQEEASGVCQTVEEVPTVREQAVSTPEVQNVQTMEDHDQPTLKVEDVDIVLGEKAEDLINERDSGMSLEKEKDDEDTMELGVPIQRVEDPAEQRVHGVSVQKVDDVVKTREQYMFDLTHDMDEATIEELMYNDQDVLDLDIMSPENDGYLQQGLGVSSRDTKCEGLSPNPTYVQEELPSWYDAPSRRHEESISRPFSAASQPVSSFAASVQTSALEQGRWNQGRLSQEAVPIDSCNAVWSSIHATCTASASSGQAQCEAPSSIRNDRSLQIFSNDRVDSLGFLRLAVQASEARGAFVPPQFTTLETPSRVVPSVAGTSSSMPIPVMTESITAPVSAPSGTSASTTCRAAPAMAPSISPLVSSSCETESVSTAWEAAPVMAPSISQAGSTSAEAIPAMNESHTVSAASFAPEAATSVLRPNIAPYMTTAAEAAPDIMAGMNPSVNNARFAPPFVSSTVATPFSTSCHAAPNMQMVSTAPTASPVVMTVPSSAHGKSVLQPKPEPVEFDTLVGTPVEAPNTHTMEEFTPVESRTTNTMEEFVPVKPEWEANGAVILDKRELNIFALKTFELSRIRWAQIQMNIDPKRVRADLKVACEMRKKGLWLNEDRPIGECPGVRVGDCFTYRIEMAIIGLHRTVQAGIAAIPAQYNPYGVPIAGSIVMNVHDNYTYKDDKDMGDRVIYSGQGGLATDKSRTYTDQKPLRGNAALLNSEKYRLPVRLIRGYKMHGTSTGSLFSYDGLYRVIDHEYRTGVNGNQVYLFHLVRLPDQAPMKRPCVSSLLYPAAVGPFPSPLDARATLPSSTKGKAREIQPQRSEDEEWGEELEEKPPLFILPRQEQSTPSKAGTSRPSRSNPQAGAFETSSTQRQSQEQVEEYEEKPRLLFAAFSSGFCVLRLNYAYGNVSKVTISRMFFLIPRVVKVVSSMSRLIY